MAQGKVLYHLQCKNTQRHVNCTLFLFLYQKEVSVNIHPLLCEMLSISVHLCIGLNNTKAGDPLFFLYLFISFTRCSIWEQAA